MKFHQIKYSNTMTIRVMMTTTRIIKTVGVRLRHGSTMTVDELSLNAEDGMVASRGIERCSSFVIGSKTKRDMMVWLLIKFCGFELCHAASFARPQSFKLLGCDF